MKKKAQVQLTQEDITLLLFLLSKEIIEYRKVPYSGVQLHVQSCTDARRKLKRALGKIENEEEGQHTPN